MEFYKTAIQCTPEGWYVPADVGALFNSSGAIKFTVHSEGMKVFWGMELVRESDRLEEHIERFGTEDRYNVLSKRFTEHRLLDFCMVEDLDSDVQQNNSSVLTLRYNRSFVDLYYFSTKYSEGVKINQGYRNIK